MSDTANSNGTTAERKSNATVYEGASAVQKNVHSEVPTLKTPDDPTYLNACAALSVAPSGVGEELSEYVSDVVQVIRNSGLPNRTTSMFTEIEGDIDDVLRVVRDAARVLPEHGHRTDVMLKLDIRPGFSGQMQRKPQLVDEILARRQQEQTTEK